MSTLSDLLLTLSGKIERVNLLKKWMFLALGFIFSSNTQAEPLLGQSPARVAEVLGEPLQAVHDSRGEVLAQVYCVGGLYLSDWYKSDLKTLTQMVPFKAFTVGPCSSDPLSPISLYARYEAGKLSMMAYTTRYQHTLDRGWGIFMDGLIADEETVNLEHTVIQDARGLELSTDRGFRYANGLSTQRVLPLEPSTMIGVAWYALGVVADGEKNTLTGFLLEQYRKLEGF